MDYNELYINGTLPSAFTDKENEEYFLKVQNGDIGAKDEIKEHNLRLVMNIINKKFYNVEGIDKTELFSIGTFALNKAVDTFNTDKGTKFSTYAVRVITNEILMSLRSVKHSKNDVSLESIVYEGKDGENLTLENMIASEDNLEEKYLNEELIKEVKKSLDILSATEREVIELAYGFRGNLYKQIEISEILGISQSNVSRIISKAQKRISEHLISQGLIDSSKVMLNVYAKETTPNDKTLTYAKAIVENNIQIDELSSICGVSVFSIKNLITKKLPSLDNELYIKVKGILEMKENEKNIKSSDSEIQETLKIKGKNLFNLFPDYSEEEINKALEKLETKEKEILLLRYPVNGESSKTLNFIAQKYDIKIGSINAKINGIVKKVKKALEGGKEVSIFEYFKEYTKEQVIEAISTLKDDSKNIIELKYGLNGKKITSTKDIAKLYDTNSNTMSGRIYAIRKSIQTRLEKTNNKKENQVNSLELAHTKVEQIKVAILDGTFNDKEMIYNVNDIKIEIQKVEAKCLITGKDKKFNSLDRAHSLNKNCLVYIIRIIDLNKKRLSEDVLVQDLKTKKVYRFIKRDSNGEYDLNSLKYGELVCYDVKGIHIEKVKKEEQVESKSIVNTLKVKNETPKDNSKEKQAKEFLQSGIKLFHKGNLVKARKHFLEALASGETYTLQQTNYYLGKIELCHKNNKLSEKYLNTSLKYNSKDYNTLLELGRNLSLQGRYEEANICFEKCKKLKPNFNDAIRGQARNFIRQNKYEEALECYDKAILIGQNIYYLYLEKGNLLYELGRYEESKNVLNACNMLSLNKKLHNEVLGKIIYLEGDKTKAIELFDELFEYDSKEDNVLPSMHIGFFFHSLGEKELAYKYYSKCLAHKKKYEFSEEFIIEHISKHMGNDDNETLHSVFNFQISMDILNDLIKDIDKTSIIALYDVYQVYCENAGYKIIDGENTEKQDYITIKTAPFTKRVLLAYPDHKIPDVEVTKSVNLEDLINFGKKVEEPLIEPKQVELVENKDITVITDKNISNSSFEECRNQVRMFINMLTDPTEQVVLLLRLGYVRDKNYTESEISKFLNISEEEVKTIINKSLTNLSLISTNTLNFLRESKKVYELK